ncbi:unnamed protein product [Closterium sp. Naga37s-1]|nr:unnamed protein product [Closterium sp. Naga37s-1]
MAAEGVTTAVTESVKEAVLAAVREELAAHKEEVDELRHMLTAVKGELVAVKGEFTAIKGELVVVTGELAVVKGELAKHKDAMAEKVTESSRALDGTGLKGKSRKRKQEITADVAREEERRREVQELNQLHATEDLAASKEGPKKRNLKLNVALQIKQSRGDQKTAWKQIKSASRRAELSLKSCDGHHKRLRGGGEEAAGRLGLGAALSAPLQHFPPHQQHLPSIGRKEPSSWLRHGGSWRPAAASVVAVRAVSNKRGGGRRGGSLFISIQGGAWQHGRAMGCSSSGGEAKSVTRLHVLTMPRPSSLSSPHSHSVLGDEQDLLLEQGSPRQQHSPCGPVMRSPAHPCGTHPGSMAESLEAAAALVAVETRKRRDSDWVIVVMQTSYGASMVGEERGSSSTESRPSSWLLIMVHAITLLSLPVIPFLPHFTSLPVSKSSSSAPHHPSQAAP